MQAEHGRDTLVLNAAHQLRSEEWELEIGQQEVGQLEVGQLEIPLVARHQERVTQPGEAVVCGEVEEVSVVLVRYEHLARIKS